MLQLKSKGVSKVGNGIMYGGQLKTYHEGTEEAIQVEVFFVETDYGNHMTLTWPELEQMFSVVAVRDYGQWRLDRQRLHDQPTLDQEAFLKGMGFDEP